MSANSHTVELINEPRDFAIEELFFSTTDLKGRIQAANGVFRRIAGYSWDEMLNKPHNIIRHPDMPRVVFQLLWEYIQGGRPIVAYVKNLAKDGRYYWVVALVVPIPNGYLSVRFKPTSPLFGKVKQLYSELRSIEAEIEGDSRDRKAAMATSGEALNSTLHTLGFASYDVFMQEVLKVEMQSREAGIRRFAASAGHADAAFGAEPSTHSNSFETAARMFDRLLEILNSLFRDLETYVKINSGVRAKSENVTDIAESLRVSALNGALEADRLGANAVGVRPILDWLRSFSEEITTKGVGLSAALVELIRHVDMVIFSLSAARLQIEMTATFAHELVDSARLGRQSQELHTTEAEIECLHASSCQTVRQALGSLLEVKARLKDLTDSQLKLLQSSRFLRPLYLKGKIEMADGAGPKLEMVFKDVSNQLNETVSNLNGLKDLLDELESHLVRGLATGNRIEEAIAQIDAQLASNLHYAH